MTNVGNGVYYQETEVPIEKWEAIDPEMQQAVKDRNMELLMIAIESEETVAWEFGSQIITVGIRDTARPQGDCMVIRSSTMVREVVDVESR